MHRIPTVIGSLGALLLAATSYAQAPASEVEAHIAAARAAAGQEYRATFVNLCMPAAPRGAGPGPAAGPRAGGPPATPERSNWYASPYQVFDNLYWLGTRQHSSWALRTSAGLILIDTNFAWATQQLMEIADKSAQGRVVSVLEGGYDLEGLAGSVAAHVTALMRG